MMNPNTGEIRELNNNTDAREQGFTMSLSAEIAALLQFVPEHHRVEAMNAYNAARSGFNREQRRATKHGRKHGISR